MFNKMMAPVNAVNDTTSCSYNGSLAVFSVDRKHLDTSTFPASDSTLSTLTAPTTSLQSYSEWKRKVKCTTGVTPVSENIIGLLAKVSPKSDVSQHFNSLNKPTDLVGSSSSKPNDVLLSLNQNPSLFVPSLYSHHLNSSNVKANEQPISQYGKSSQYRYTPLQADYYYFNSIPTTVNCYLADSWPISGTVRPTPEFQPPVDAINTSSYTFNSQRLNCEVSKINTVLLQPDKALASSFPWQQSKFNGISSSTTSTVKTPVIKKCSSGPRKNVWKNQTYADFICKAILSSPAKKLTLSQIYDWLTDNIDYFKTKKEGKSSVGWKNSIRHNLSLHSRFVRMQGNESGKSSWWTVDLSAKSSRRKSRKTLENSVAKRSAKNSSDAALVISNRLKNLPLCSPQTHSEYHPLISYSVSTPSIPLIGYSVSTPSIPSLYSTINGKVQTGYDTGAPPLTRASNVAATGYKEESAIEIVPYCCNSPYQFSCPTTQSCCYSTFLTNSTPMANAEAFYYNNNNTSNNDVNFRPFTCDKNDSTTASCCRYPSQYISSNSSGSSKGYDCYPYFGATAACFPFYDSASNCILHSFSKNDFNINNSKLQPSIIPSTYSYPDYPGGNFSDFDSLHTASQGLDACYYSCYPNHCCCYDYDVNADRSSIERAADETPALNGSAKNQELGRLSEDCLVISIMK